MKEKETITLNGVIFPVGKNLAGALRCLRRLNGPDSSRLLWIDALCINQDDLDERARQVKLMGDIYFRATRVTVWLGEKYKTYQSDLSPDIVTNPEHRQTSFDVSSQESSPTTPQVPEAVETGYPSSLGLIIQPLSWLLGPWKSSNSETGVPKSSDGESSYTSQSEATHSFQNSTTLSLIDELFNDGYWQRLWIIQEIGQARDIQVSFGTWTFPWSQFMEFLRACRSTGRPLKLDEKLRTGSTENRTLRSLLTDHQDAMCQDARDKVFGLIGLTLHGSDFPVDYTKSPFEVWTDTMNHIAIHESLNDDEWVDFGRLVKSLIVEPVAGLIGNVVKPSYPTQRPTSNKEQDMAPIRISTYILGSICTLGPSVQDFTAKMDLVIDWKAAMRTNYKRDVVKVDRESRVLLRCILDATDEALSDMASDQFERLDILGEDESASSISSYLPFRSEVQRLKQLSTTSAPSDSQDDESLETTGDGPRLYQLQLCNPVETLPKLGIAPPTAELGDLVCRVKDSHHAVLIRDAISQSERNQSEHSVHMDIRGMAMVTEDLVEVVSQNSEHANDYGVPVDKDITSGAIHLSVNIDAWILYGLIS